MPDFTKGHWSVENGIDIISDFHKNAYIAQLYLIPDEKEHDANAKLIAAAPDMYNFVRCVYEMSKTLDEEDDDYFIHEAAKKILDRIHGSEDHANDTDA